MDGYRSPYGREEGLRERLAEWSEQLGKGRDLPWMGMGLIADLEAAVRVLGDGTASTRVYEYDL